MQGVAGCPHPLWTKQSSFTRIVPTVPLSVKKPDASTMRGGADYGTHTKQGKGFNIVFIRTPV
jgi:hypothetical protein